MQETLPRITVVTPSYNQAQFLEQTILSVIGQGYPNLEYIVMDGGSKDGSVDIIKKYESNITYWQSQKDNGQGAAINAGFSRATGDILCWLNSDDLYMPGTLLKIGRLFKDVTEPMITFGNCLHFYENSAKTRGSDVEKHHKELQLELCDYVIQPSSFWNRQAWVKTGIIDESFHYVFDWEWFIRAKRSGVIFSPQRDYLSLYRIHDAHKSGVGGDKRSKELAEIYGKYNDEKVKKAFAKWDRYNTTNKLVHNAVYAARTYDLKTMSKLLHFLLLPSVSYSQYNNITRM